MTSQEWRFTDEHGVERTIDTNELRSALSSGKIAPSTLVWRDGLKEWAPAFTLPELSSAAIAAARSSRASIPPAGAASPSDSRPRSVPPPLPKRERIPSVAPPAPIRRPHRGPMRTLTGIEPPEVLASLGIVVDLPKADATAAPTEARTINEEPTRDVTADDDEAWDDATDVIPRAPKVPKEAANLPKTSRRIPSIPPPPLPANPTPPPRDGAPEVPHRPTLMGLAQRKPSKPPPKRSTAPAASSSDKTAVAAPPSPQDAGRSKPPPPPNRKKPEVAPAPAPAGGAKRLNRTLEIETKLDKSKPRAPEAPRVSADSPTVLDAGEIRPPAPATAPETPKVQPASERKKPTAPKDSLTGSITTVKKTAEGTVIMERPVKPPPGETTDLIAARPKDAAALAEAEESKPPRRAKTLEMALEDHHVAAEKHPESPASVTSVPKPKGEDTGTTFGVDEPERAPEPESEPVSAPPEIGPRKKSALEVPLSSLVAASLVWIVGLLAFFFVGRVSGFKSAGNAPVARDGFADRFLSWTPPMQLAGVAGPSGPKPCSVTRQPKKWATNASKSVPFDMRAEEELSLLGFAQGDHEGVGLKIDPKTGKFEEMFRLKVEGEVTRVSPTGTTDGFFVGVKGDRTVIPVSARTPRFLVIEKGTIGATDALDQAPANLWTLEGEGEISAENAVRVTEETFFLTFRRGSDVIGGYFGADKTAKSQLVKVPGSGGKVGKPRNGTNGTDVAVVFADKPEKDDAHWQIRIGRATIGQIPETTEDVVLPEGGPGGDAIAPDIIGLADGRWLLMWTEGQSGERSILAQTYDKQFAPVGDPIALSPPAGSFGQAVLGVVGTYTTVAFLQAADEGFEMWGAVLQCGN
ncbi:MAG: DUF4339 domain-containing protein [Myxococcales bacterium]|nr:DUF4339 domain-containing protein [Myxococcales bacterium]